mmetsp:Transcript_48002/g.79052  ORF Transcript_48002/g.79052 Transcript_48002/m.79052 type:complete len:124 (-) Transcript_48002:52-423(-)
MAPHNLKFGHVHLTVQSDQFYRCFAETGKSFLLPSDKGRQSGCILSQKVSAKELLLLYFLDAGSGERKKNIPPMCQLQQQKKMWQQIRTIIIKGTDNCTLKNTAFNGAALVFKIHVPVHLDIV